MAITRLSNSGIATGGVLKYDSAAAGYPPAMAAPTAADGGTGTTATVSFTAVSGATTYTALSSPGSFTATGASSPLTVSGLTAGTAYTFQIRANNSVGSGPYSAASNSVTPIVPNSFESIATTTLTSQQNSISLQNIPQTFAHLEIHVFARSITGVNADDLIMWMNADQAGASYWNIRQVANTSYTSQATNGSGGAVLRNAIIGSNIGSNYFGTLIIRIPNYKSTNSWKPFIYWNSTYPGNTSTSNDVAIGMGVWTNAASAISRLDFNPPGSAFPADTQIALYGIKES